MFTSHDLPTLLYSILAFSISFPRLAIFEPRNAKLLESSLAVQSSVFAMWEKTSCGDKDFNHM